MKKLLLALLMTLMLIAGLVACANEPDTVEPEPTPEEVEAPVETPEPIEPEEDQDEAVSDGEASLNSVIFTENGAILSLGDIREAFDAVFGEGTALTNAITYLGGHFGVVFEDNIATMFIAMEEALEQLEFLVFDHNRGISPLLRELTLGGDFVEMDDQQYVRVFDIDGVQHTLLVQMALTGGAMTHVGTILLGMEYESTSPESESTAEAPVEEEPAAEEPVAATLEGTWLWNGSPYYVLEAGGRGTMAGSDIRWSTRGGVFIVCSTPDTCGSRCLAPMEWRYVLDGNRLTLTSTLIPDMTYTYTRR
jgi:hypothetical protein